MKVLSVVSAVCMGVACTACAGAQAYKPNSNPRIYFPALPASISNAGEVTPIPDVKSLTKEQTNELILKLAANERKNAAAVNAAKYYHKQLQGLYNRYTRKK